MVYIRQWFSSYALLSSHVGWFTKGQGGQLLKSLSKSVQWVWSEVAQSCPTLCDPMDCSLSGSSVHGIFQARVLEWIAISFSRGSSRPRNWTKVSHIAGRRFTVWATREVWLYQEVQLGNTIRKIDLTMELEAVLGNHSVGRLRWHERKCIFSHWFENKSRGWMCVCSPRKNQHDWVTN